MKKVRIDDALMVFRQENLAKGLSAATHKYYEECLNYFLKWLPPKVKFCFQCDKELFSDYAIYLESRLDNKTSINTFLRAVRRFFNFMAEKGYSVEQKLRLLRDDVKLKETFTKEEVANIFGRAGLDMDSLICVFLLGTGVRSSTLCSLNVSDVNLSENIILLRSVKNKRQFILPLSEMLVRLLSEYIEINQLSRHSPLFPNSRGGRQDKCTLYRRIERYLDSIGIDRHGVHIFRHTFSKLMAMNGCDSITLMHWLGHQSVQQSQHYVNIYGNELRISMEKYNPIVKFAEKFT